MGARQGYVAGEDEGRGLAGAERNDEDGVGVEQRYMEYTREDKKRNRANNWVERGMIERGERTRVVGEFPDGNSALMQGFIVSNFTAKFPEAMKQLSQWLSEGKLTYSETIVEGFDQIPQAFIDLFDGKNKGKMVVKI